MTAALGDRGRAALEGATSCSVAAERLSQLLTGRFRLCRVSVRVVQGDRLVIAGLWTNAGTALHEGAGMRVTASSFPQIARTGEPVLYSGPDDLPELVDHILLEEGIRSWVSLPLRAGDEVVGLLSLSSSERAGITEDDLPELKALAAAVEGPLISLCAEDAVRAADGREGGSV